jgi:hypothetical protein
MVRKGTLGSNNCQQKILRRRGGGNADEELISNHLHPSVDNFCGMKLGSNELEKQRRSNPSSKKIPNKMFPRKLKCKAVE